MHERIPAVIATTRKIGDEVARKFAKDFYTALASGHSIKEAFGMAAGSNEAAGEKEFDIHFRSIKVPATKPEESKEFPWGLYCQEGNEAALDWKLPNQSFIQFVFPQQQQNSTPGAIDSSTIRS